jgi:hypothetical protein
MNSLEKTSSLKSAKFFNSCSSNEKLSATKETQILSAFQKAEEAFMDYFLNKVAPSNDSEKKRNSIFEKVKLIIESALGKHKLNNTS